MRRIVIILVAACAPGIYRAPVREASYYSIDAAGKRSDTYSRINEWSSYGTHGLGAQSTIAAAYEQAQHAAPPANAIEIFNASLPPGVTIDHGTVQIDKSAPYEAVGRFEIGYWKSSAPHETEIEPDLRRLAAVTDGDTVIVEVQRRDHADDRVEFLTGIVLRKHMVALVADKPAHREHAQAHLVYSANGSGCLSEAEFADEVSAKLGYSPWRTTGPALRTEIHRDSGAYRAQLTLGDGSPKQLSGATCKAVIDAAVTVVVVELDDRAARIE